MEDICPWSTLAPATLQWCERQLCSWIREPANTWSNLAYIIIGIMILIECRKANLGPQRILGFFAILLGLMSGFYHASGSLIGEIVDLSSMFLISVYIISANYAPLHLWSQKKANICAVSLG
ncbi:MAG: ceramidase domain-containing protein, partial [Bdellovibrionota bacterium]